MKFTLRAKSHRENRLWHYNTCTIYLLHWDADNLENTTKSDLARNTACSSTAALQFQPGSTLSKTTPARSLYLSRISLTMTFLPLAISPSFSRWAHVLKGGKFSTGGITMVYCCFSYFTRMRHRPVPATEVETYPSYNWSEHHATKMQSVTIFFACICEVDSVDWIVLHI